MAATTRTIKHSNFADMMSQISREVANVLTIRGAIAVRTDTGYQIFDDETYSHLNNEQKIIVTVTPNTGKRVPTAASQRKLGFGAANDESRGIHGVFKIRGTATAVPRQMLHSRNHVRRILRELDARLDELEENSEGSRIGSNANEMHQYGSYLSALFDSSTKIAEVTYIKKSDSFEINAMTASKPEKWTKDSSYSSKQAVYNALDSFLTNNKHW